MNFVVPGLLGLTALMPVLIVFYLLKVRRVDFEVSSTLLWSQLYRDVAAHEPWQRLRFNLLLILQLLFMLIVILALARPYLISGEGGAENVVVLLDSSASMQATDVSPSRFEVAKKAATDFVNGSGDQTSFIVIAVKDRPETLLGETTNKREVLRAIAQAHPGSTTTNMREAVILALSLLKGKPHAEVNIFSDGAFGDLGAVGAAGIALHLSPVGQRAENQGITVMSVRTNPLDRTQSEAFVRVQNEADHAGTNVVSLLADGKLIASKDVNVPAQGKTDVSFTDLPLNARVLEARLQKPDDLALDNAAIAVLNRNAAPRILYVSSGNLFLENVLRLLPIRLFRADAGSLSSLDMNGYDVVVFDNVMPSTLPSTNVLLINPSDSPLLKVNGSLGTGGLAGVESNEPLLRYVDLSTARLLKARSVEAPGWARTIATTNGQPAIMVGEERGRRVGIVAFDLHDSDLPLKPSFPILINNLVSYVEPRAEEGVEQSTAGGTVLLQPFQNATSIKIRKPDQSTVTLQPDSNRQISFDQTDEVGLYVVTQYAGTQELGGQLFAVNLLDANESNIQPAKGLKMTQDTANVASGPAPPLRREYWPMLALIGLAVLIGEWWWYHRRA
jgi:hypothetical protein